MKKKVKKVKFEDLKFGVCFKRKKDRTLYMRTEADDAQILTGKKKGSITLPYNDELVTPVKVKISEVK